MWYRFSAEIPLNRLRTNPYVREFTVPEGVVHRVRMRYPPGPRGMVSSAVFLGAAKIFPMDESEWFVGEDEWVEGTCHVVTRKGWHWSIQGYSPGTANAHTVYVDLFVLSEEKVTPWMVLSDFVAIMKKLIGV